MIHDYRFFRQPQFFNAPLTCLIDINIWMKEKRKKKKQKFYLKVQKQKNRD